MAQNACTGSVITKPQGLRDAPAGGYTALHSRITTRPSPRPLVHVPPGDLLARAVPSAGAGPADARARTALSATRRRAEIDIEIGIESEFTILTKLAFQHGYSCQWYSNRIESEDVK